MSKRAAFPQRWVSMDIRDAVVMLIHNEQGDVLFLRAQNTNLLIGVRSTRYASRKKMPQTPVGGASFTKRAGDRSFLPGVWALPSGHIEEHEPFLFAAMREAEEELAIQVRRVNLLKIIHKPCGDKTRVYVVDIPASYYSGTPTIQTKEFDALQWMRLDDFYQRFTDEEIGSTLRHLRHHFTQG